MGTDYQKARLRGCAFAMPSDGQLPGHLRVLACLSRKRENDKLTVDT
jgi:hypothetical protein